MRSQRPAIVGLLILLAAGRVEAQEQHLPLDRGWDLQGPGPTRVEPFLGQQALRLRTARAIRRDVSFQDGTIEFDMAVTPRRSFVYIQFRMASDEDHEEIYFRPHKSELPDAIQYTPVFRGESAWQLYHGPGRTAAIAFARDQWIHVRLVVQGARAALYVGGEAVPALVMRLAREPRAGYLALRSFAPGGDANELVAAFANVVVRPGVVTPIPPGPEIPAAAPGTITSWQVSPAFAPADNPARSLPDSILRNRERWPSYATDEEGRLVLDRYIARPADRTAAVARLVLRADQPGLRQLDLGFSDEYTLFVNGQPVAAGYDYYSADRPRVEGLLTPQQATVWLPLRAGENEVLILVADVFGGWGLMGVLGR